VIYSLGNFVSNQRDRYRDGGIIFNVTLEKHNFIDKGATRNITDVHYIPTWVYVHHTSDKNQFFILPVFQYLKNDQPLQLPDDSYQKMLTFYKDTQEHLAPRQTPKRQRNILDLSNGHKKFGRFFTLARGGHVSPDASQ
jgi:poly-gamma-glutamate synthesis protein (capsule biosynthesis protein)